MCVKRWEVQSIWCEDFIHPPCGNKEKRKRKNGPSLSTGSDQSHPIKSYPKFFGLFPLPICSGLRSLLRHTVSPCLSLWLVTAAACSLDYALLIGYHEERICSSTGFATRSLITDTQLSPLLVMLEENGLTSCKMRYGNITQINKCLEIKQVKRNSGNILGEFFQDIFDKV